MLTELHYANRKEGEQSAAAMFKLSIAPTSVPTGKADPWARPHLRLIYSIAWYNDFASTHLYSPYLNEIGPQKWGQLEQSGGSSSI